MPFTAQKIFTSSQLKLSRSYGTKEYPSILYYFRKTPKSIVCPHFWELRWAYGCPFDCAYCYLQGTFRGKKEPRYVPLEHVFLALEAAFNDSNLEPSIFNSGELADSLMNPKIMEKIADKFEEQSKHKLLLLTKSDNVDFLVEKLRKQTIASFSLNARKVWELWEHRTPSPDRRIKAAKSLMEVGYNVRVRIDPIFPIENWQMHYEDLIYSMLSNFSHDPERITLGTPRGLQKTLMFSKDDSWTKWFTESSGWGKKIATATRKEIYVFFLDKLTAYGFDKSKIAICKETEMMWSELGLNKHYCMCNCVR
jgi:spore photoproduct lyase